MLRQKEVRSVAGKIISKMLDRKRKTAYTEHSSFWKEIDMNTVVTSREAILRVSRDLIREQGWAAVNIRAVANACDISVGTVYNYFQSKADLLAATVESVWFDIFHFPEGGGAFDSFTGCVEWAFDSMKKGDEKYPGFFTLHSMSFVGEEKSGAQQRMAQSRQHMKERLLLVLANDPNVRSDVFDDSFTRKKFVEIVFSLILSACLQRDYDSAAILGMIRRVLY